MFLNDKIKAYLAQSNIAFDGGDYKAVQPEGKPDQIVHWDPKLGPRAEVERGERRGLHALVDLFGHHQVTVEQAVVVVDGHRGHAEERGHPRESAAGTDEERRACEQTALNPEIVSRCHERPRAPHVRDVVEYEGSVLVHRQVRVEEHDRRHRRSPLHDGPVMAQFMNDLGDVYFQASREEDALQAFGQAIAYDETHPDGPAARDIREQLLSRSNRVYTRWGLCDLEGARQDSAELRGVLAQRLGQRHALLLNQTRLGVMVANELARYDEALALIERQLPLVDRSKPEWGKWHVAFLSDRALAWAHSGQPGKAWARSWRSRSSQAAPWPSR